METETLADLNAKLRARTYRGFKFARFAQAVAFARGDSFRGHQIAETLARRAPAIAEIFKAAISAGSTASGSWGSSTSSYDSISAEFIELSNSLDIYGPFRERAMKAPFNTRTIIATSPTFAAFAGIGKPIPVSALSISATERLERYRIGVIDLITEELAELASESSIAQIRDSLALTVARGTATALIDPDSAGSAESTPASLTSGVSPLGAFGSTAALALASFNTLLSAQVAAGSDLRRVIVVMHPATLLALSLLRGTSGEVSFPTINATGESSISGVPIYPTASAVRSGSPSERLVVAIDAARVALADENEIEISASSIASLQADSAPTNTSAGTTQTSMVSLFQTGTVAMKAIRHLNWKKAHSNAAVWMTSSY